MYSALPGLREMLRAQAAWRRASYPGLQHWGGGYALHGFVVVVITQYLAEAEEFTLKRW